MARPSCDVNLPGSGPSAGAIVGGTVSAVFTAASAAATIYKIVTAASAFYPMAAAVVAAIAVIATVIYFAVDRCGTPSGFAGCMAGVIEDTVPAFNDAAEQLFPFTSLHDRVDVVIKAAYWDALDAKSPYVYCSANDGSPMVPAFYYNKAVCNAGVGASVGATVGAVAGLLIAAAAVAAIGCATWILCLLALIVAVIIAVVAAILGAMAGGAIGRAATATQAPSSSGGGLIPAQPLVAGDYVSTSGNMAECGDLNSALSFMFVQHTTLHGKSLSSASFSHLDPDTNLQHDACDLGGPPIG
jgi:hypothetical protein